MSSVKNNLVYRARREGVRINNKTRTIYASNHPTSKSANRLINEFGFCVQLTDICMKDVTDTRVYISLPINSINPSTGQSYDIDSQRKYSYTVEKVMHRNGYRTFNPFRNGLDPDAAICDHMRADYRQLTQCDAIVMCPGWEYYSGCKHELLIAVDMRLKILFLTTENTISF